MTTSTRFDLENHVANKDRGDMAKTIDCIRDILSPCVTTKLGLHLAGFEMQVCSEILIVITDE